VPIFFERQSLLRGEEVISMTVEGPPPPLDENQVKAVGPLSGPGLGRAAGRGMSLVVQAQPPGLSELVRGVCGPMMQPQISRPPPPTPMGYVPPVVRPGQMMGI
ncbi:hypothetical protein Tco_0670926, partial [Tanacetum coccineum]